MLAKHLAPVDGNYPSDVDLELRADVTSDEVMMRRRMGISAPGCVGLFAEHVEWDMVFGLGQWRR